MEETHTFLSRPPNFVSLQKLQEERLKEKREEEERQKRLLEEEEEEQRKKILHQQQQEEEERIRTSNESSKKMMKKKKKKKKKALKGQRGDEASESQEQNPQIGVEESIDGSEKSKKKSGSERKKKWPQRKMEREILKSAKVEVAAAAEERSERGKPSREEAEMIKKTGDMTIAINQRVNRRRMGGGTRDGNLNLVWVKKEQATGRTVDDCRRKF